jgi:hypothetical protein
MDLRLITVLTLFIVIIVLISYYLRKFLKRGEEVFNDFLRETLISKPVSYKLKPLAVGTLKLFAYSSIVFIFLFTYSIVYLVATGDVYIFKILSLTNKIIGVIVFLSMILLFLIFITFTLVDISMMSKRRRDISREIFVKKLISYTIMIILIIVLTTLITIDLKKGIETIQRDLNSLISQL